MSQNTDQLRKSVRTVTEQLVLSNTGNFLKEKLLASQKDLRYKNFVGQRTN